MSGRQIKILPMRMSDEGPRLRLPGATSLPLSVDELRKVLAVVEDELRAKGETWARLMPATRALPADITAGSTVPRASWARFKGIDYGNASPSRELVVEVSRGATGEEIRMVVVDEPGPAAEPFCVECDGLGVRGGCATCGMAPW